jgi:hypothetical protein
LPWKFFTFKNGLAKKVMFSLLGGVKQDEDDEDTHLNSSSRAYCSQQGCFLREGCLELFPHMIREEF